MIPFGKTQNGLFAWSGLSFMLVKSKGIGVPVKSTGRGICIVDCVGGAAELVTCIDGHLQRGLN